jgi:DNA (cytosine-5)-methyltransferase 1
MSKAYYNDNDPMAAQWLRHLVAAGELPEGDVDERSIKEIQPADLQGYTQVHLFAGIGGWPLALARGGWPATEPVWTGSCPCQPFSAAGKGRGEDDPRHLWPDFFRLIAECRPATVFGEQVASQAGRLWLSGVRDDVEALGYAVGAADLCAAGVGAPHIRQRLYWVAQSRQQQARRGGSRPREGSRADEGGASGEPRGSGAPNGLDDATGHGAGRPDAPEPSGDGTDDGLPRATGAPDSQGVADAGLGSPERGRRRGEACSSPQASQREAPERARRGDDVGDNRADDGVVYTEGQQVDGSGQPWALSDEGRGHWDDFDIVYCDERAFGRGYVPRRVEPGTFPLALRVPGDVVKLRAYGNAISPPLAAEFVAAYLETERETQL